MTFDAQIQSITQDYIVPKVTDQTLKSNVLTLLVLANGNPWFGESLKFPVKLSNSTQNGSFSDYDEFQTGNENTRQVASFDPRAYYQSVVIGGIARSVNNISKTQLLNLVKVEMESAHQDMTDGIGSIMYLDGTGNSSKDFLGAKAAVDDGTSVATYGGLSRSTYAKWASALYTSIGAWDFTKARTLMNKATTGNLKPTVVTVDQTTFGYVEADFTSIVSGQLQVMEAQRGMLTRNGIKPMTMNGLVGQQGFDVLFYAGTPFVKDEKATTQSAFAFNLPYLRWYGAQPAETSPINLSTLYVEGNDIEKSGAPSTIGFGWTGFVRPSKQFAFIGQIILLGNMVTPAPRLHTIGSGITS